MQQYLLDFKEAVERTERLGLEKPNITYRIGERFINKDFSVGALSHLFQEFFGIIQTDEEYTQICRKEFLGKCITVNNKYIPHIRSWFFKLFNADAYFTIGYLIFKNGSTAFEFDEEWAKKRLVNWWDFKLKEKIHVWITLPTMEIIDLTYEITNTLANNKDLIISTNIGPIATYISQIEKFRYVPMIIGRQFCLDTGILLEE